MIAIGGLKFGGRRAVEALREGRRNNRKYGPSVDKPSSLCLGIVNIEEFVGVIGGSSRVH